MPRPNTGGISTNAGPSAPRPVPGFSANGDLGGGLLSQEVIGVRGTRVLTSGGSLTPGYVLTAASEDEADWLPGGGGGGGPAVDIGALHPASAKRMVGGLILPSIPGGPSYEPGSVLTATGYSTIRGSTYDETSGIWALGDGVVHQIGFPVTSDQIVGAIPLYDDNASAVASGPQPMCAGAGKIWTLTQVGNVSFDSRGTLTRINPNVGVEDYFGNISGQAVIDGRVSFDEFPGSNSISQVFYDVTNDKVVVYSPSAFLDKAGGVFYEVNPVSLSVEPYTLTNSDSPSFWDNLNYFLAFQFADDGNLHALANALVGADTQIFLVKIDTSTRSIVEVFSFGENPNVSQNNAKLQYSNLNGGKFYWVDDVGMMFRASLSPYQDDGVALDLGNYIAYNLGGGYSGRWGVQGGGAYDQTIGVAVGSNADGDTVLLDINLFDMTIPGSYLVVHPENGNPNGNPYFNHLLYVPYPESGWWLFDDNAGKAYRYFGGGYESPYGRFPYGGLAEWRASTAGTWSTVGVGTDDSPYTPPPTVTGIRCSTDGDFMTVQLPPGTDGRIIAVWDGNGGAGGPTQYITILPDGSETIVGASEFRISTNYGGVQLVWYQGNWAVVGQFMAPQKAVIQLVAGIFTTTSGTFVRATSYTLYSLSEYPERIGPFIRQVEFQADLDGEGCGGAEVTIRLQNITDGETVTNTEMSAPGENPGESSTVESGPLTVGTSPGDLKDLSLYEVQIQKSGASVSATVTNARLEITYVPYVP